MQIRAQGERESAWLRFELSKHDVAQHGLERDKMHDNIKYNAAVDSLSQQKELIRQLLKYVSAERLVNRDVVAQNAVLIRELKALADVANRKSSQLKKARGVVDSLIKEMGVKDEMIRSSQNQLLLTKSQYDERIQRMDNELYRKSNEDGEFFEGLMKEYGVSRDDIVERVKEFKGSGAQEKAIKDLEKKLSTLQNKYQEQEKKRKNAEKTVKEQKKEITEKTKRIKSLEESLKIHEQMTPAAPKSVKRAMNAVENIMGQLGTSPVVGDSTPKVPAKMKIDSDSNMSAVMSTGQGSVSKRSAGKRAAEPKLGSSNKTQRTEVSPSVHGDVSIWNPDSEKFSSEKENASLAMNPSKALSFAVKELSSATGGHSVLNKKKGVVKTENPPGGSKRKLLSVSAHNRNQPMLQPSSKKTFSIPKLQ